MKPNFNEQSFLMQVMISFCGFQSNFAVKSEPNGMQKRFKFGGDLDHCEFLETIENIVLVLKVLRYLRYCSDSLSLVLFLRFSS